MRHAFTRICSICHDERHVAPRRVLTACIAVFALAGASCGSLAAGQPPEARPVETVEPELDPSPSASPRAFLEVGPEAASEVAEQPVGARVPAPRSLDLGNWALVPKGDLLEVYQDPRRGEPALRTSVGAWNPWGQRIAFPIRDVHVEGGTTWYRVLLGVQPNGASGWVDGDDVSFERLRHHVVVDLSERMLRHFRNGRLRHRFRVGIGAPGTPTTVGRFFVWAHLDPRDASGSYGSHLLGLSGFSEVLTNWPGGGRLAIHGTPDPSDIGRRVSYGCARVFNRQMDRLRHIPMGTTVMIRR